MTGLGGGVTHIYQMDKLGNLIRTINVAAIARPFGITTDGKYLWWMGGLAGNIYQLDKLGNLIQTIPIGGNDAAPRGITTDGKYLWWTGQSNDIIVQWAKN